MANLDTVVGVDACPAGWFATVIERGDIWMDTYQEFSELYTAHRDANQILVDIPIGLSGDQRRRCDIEARDLLGSRGTSVFYPPCQSAADLDDYQKANEEHENRVGYGLSQQAHSIGSKILQVAAVIGEQYDGVVRESHPELCFAALNGQPIAYSKSSNRGRGLRMKLLRDELDETDELYQNAREEHLLKEVRRDDILDSMVLAVAARMNLTSVPEAPNAEVPRIYFPDFELPSAPPL